MGYVQDIGMGVDAPHRVEIHSLCDALDSVGQVRREVTHKVTREQCQWEEYDSCEGEAAPDSQHQLEACQ
jgi:hypothetical protein